MAKQQRQQNYTSGMIIPPMSLIPCLTKERWNKLRNCSGNDRVTLLSYIPTSKLVKKIAKKKRKRNAHWSGDTKMKEQKNVLVFFHHSIYLIEAISVMVLHYLFFSPSLFSSLGHFKPSLSVLGLTTPSRQCQTLRGKLRYSLYMCITYGYITYTVSETFTYYYFLL